MIVSRTPVRTEQPVRTASIRRYVSVLTEACVVPSHPSPTVFCWNCFNHSICNWLNKRTVVRTTVAPLKKNHQYQPYPYFCYFSYRVCVSTFFVDFTLLELIKTPAEFQINVPVRKPTWFAGAASPPLSTLTCYLVDVVDTGSSILTRVCGTFIYV